MSSEHFSTWDIQFGMENEVAPRGLPREAAQLGVAEAGRQCDRLPVLRRRGGHRRVGIVVALIIGDWIYFVCFMALVAADL